MALLVVCLLASFTAFAADAPKAEVFGGYQYTRLSGEGIIPNVNANGWNGALTGNFNKWFGVTADFMMLGGGVDAKFADRMAFRVAQFDWVSLRSNGSTSNQNFRLSAGLVFHF